MRPEPNNQISADVALPDRLSPLDRPPVALRSATAEAIAPTAVPDGAAPGTDRSRTAATSPAPGGGAIEVRYGLDTVANVWVAQFFDGVTGDFVKSVPATRVKHQLAALRELDSGVDARA